MEPNEGSKAVALLSGDFVPHSRGHLGIPADFVCSNLGESTMVSWGERLRLLLNMLQCTGQPSTIKNDPAPKAKRPRLRTPDLADGDGEQR